jgi:hypothetical protein
MPIDRVVTVERGYDFELPMVYKDSAGVPVDVRAWTALMQVRPNVNSDDVLYELSSADDTIFLGQHGEVTLIVDRTVTAGWNANGVYDLRLTPLAGKDKCLIKGKFYVDPRVTQ